MNQLFTKESNKVSGFAWASLIYSLVPYLGILFVPFTIIFSIAALLSAAKAQNSESIWDGVKCLVIGSAILLVQLILWWLLFMVPFWAGQSASYN